MKTKQDSIGAALSLSKLYEKLSLFFFFFYCFYICLLAAYRLSIPSVPSVPLQKRCLLGAGKEHNPQDGQRHNCILF